MNHNLPPAISTFAGDYDSLFYFLVWASLIAGIIMLGGMIYFIVKYNGRDDSKKTAYITHNSFLEFAWSFIPLVLFMGVFVWGGAVYYKQRVAPEGAMEIQLTARQWLWEFEYKNGKKSTNVAYVPVGVPIKMVMTSADVIHSFYIPSMRTKQDVVPGMYSSLWFEAKETGVFQIFCAEFCGTNHSAMLGKIHVVEMDEYKAWLQAEEGAGKSLAERGADLYKNKGCVACHSIDGTKIIGPSFKGVWGRTEQIENGPNIVVDENYVRESILSPQAKIVKGFPPTMPPFQGVVSEDEIKSIIEWFKTLK